MKDVVKAVLEDALPTPLSKSIVIAIATGLLLLAGFLPELILGTLLTSKGVPPWFARLTGLLVVVNILLSVVVFDLVHYIHRLRSRKPPEKEKREAFKMPGME